MSFAMKGRKRSDFYKIINKPMRYISRECAMNEVVREIDVLRYYSCNKDRCKTVKEFFRHIEMISHLRPSLMMRYMRRSIGIDCIYPGSKEALDTLEEIASEFMDASKFLDFLIEKRAEETENKANKRKSDNGGNKVRLMTMHGSKGLEFEIVWIPDLNEGILPARSAVTPAQIEEERRMLYVAMTRAKKALIMSYITGTEENKMLPTRFLKPIRDLWEKNYKSDQTSSEPSSGSSTNSSNSTSSR
jgi:DNA helicase-2/ATP-dependent DNA helicase PcrA